MFDNSMTGAVGFAMHEDRQVRARRNLLLSEAAHGRTGHRTRRACVNRELIARGLVALAARIAPTTVMKPRTELAEFADPRHTAALGGA